MEKKEFTEKLIECLDMLGVQKTAEIKVTNFSFEKFNIDGKPYRGKFLNMLMKIVMLRLKKYSGQGDTPQLHTFIFMLDVRKKQYVFQNLAKGENNDPIYESY